MKSFEERNRIDELTNQERIRKRYLKDLISKRIKKKIDFIHQNFIKLYYRGVYLKMKYGDKAGEILGLISNKKEELKNKESENLINKEIEIQKKEEELAELEAEFANDEEINKLDELIDIYDIKTDIIENNKYNSEKSLLSLKENELDNFNQIYKNSTEKENKNQKKCKKDKKKSKSEKRRKIKIKIKNKIGF